MKRAMVWKMMPERKGGRLHSLLLAGSYDGGRISAGPKKSSPPTFALITRR